MRSNRSSLRLYVWVAGAISLLLVWLIVAYEVTRAREGELHEAEVLAAAQSQVFAEYSESTIKRLNELLLDLRSYWTGDWKAFAELVQRRQENIADIAFQVAIIDKDGLLAFSNLAKPDNRTDLSEREHFRVHKEAAGTDRLFISKPLKGKVSGKWSIQFTRPILRNGRFDGVLVISVSPELFASFATKLQIVGSSVLAVVRDTGEFMARHPDPEAYYGIQVKDRPFLKTDGPINGSYRGLSAADKQDRIFGYRKLDKYGFIFVIGTSVDEALEPYREHRNKVIGIGLLVSLGAVFMFFSLLRALAIQERTARDLELARDQAEAANKAKSAFLANMSHEMRTPLHHVLGFAQLVRMETLSPKQGDWLDKLNDSAKHLQDLIDKIIELSRLESEEVVLQQAPVAIDALLYEAAASKQRLAELSGLQLDVSPGQYPANLLGDAQRLSSALSGYIENAIRFTESGSVTLGASVVEEDAASVLLRFEVKDTGAGIPAEILPRLFGNFEQVDNSMTRKHGGTGIGLAMTRKLAELMGGKAGCESAVGQGSVFWFTARLQKG